MKIINRIELLNIGVKDVDKSKEFYADQLGLKVTMDQHVGMQHWVTLELPGGISLNITNAPKDKQSGSFKLGFSTPDVEVALEELSAKGIKPTKEGDDYGKWKSPGGKGERYFEVEDPDGNQVLVYQNTA